jgi:hypothetical protein
MINIFRKIRQNFRDERKAGKPNLEAGKPALPVGKYLKYALGEIFLVVVGIVIALQLNNWNEARKNQDQFNAILEQIYTVIDQDIDKMILLRYGLDKQITIIDSIQQNLEDIDPSLLPHFLFYIDLVPNDFNSEVSYHIGYLNFNPENLLQSNLNKSLISYAYAVNQEYDSNLKYLTPQLEKINLPFPSINFGYSILNDYQNIDLNFFSAEEIKRAKSILADPVIQNALKSARSRKALNSIFIENNISLARTNQDAIKNYYPEVKLLYGNIGLVGDATENNNWNDNVPLKLTNKSEAIWEADVVLDEGSVKFRNDNNWNFNWGGVHFPEGTSLSYGENIQVQAGKYHVVFNLSEKTYEFIRQDP